MRCAVFDWDNTVCGGYALFGFAEYLAERSFISMLEFDGIMAAEAGYRAGRYGHDDFARVACDAFSAILAGKDPRVMEDLAAGSVADGYRLSLFGYVRPVIRLLRRRRVRAFVVSGAPEAVIRPFAMSVGFSDVWGYAPELAEGGRVFSGRTLRNYGMGKMSAMREIMKLYGRPIVGFGDSASDVPLLRCAVRGFVVGDAELPGVNAARIDSRMQASEVVRMVSEALARRPADRRARQTRGVLYFR